MIQKMTATFQFPLMEKKRKSANEENQREYKYELITVVT